jgi:threonine/homoserine/homoserine lactone efflux protein
VRALGVLVVTAVLAVLLAVLFHLAWPPVVVAILGTVPALYLAWAALPGAISPPGRGRRGRARPAQLGL